jgi:hypothetical protein
MSGNSCSRTSDSFRNLHIERSGSTVGDSAAHGTGEGEARVLEARIESVFKALWSFGSKHTRLRALISCLGAVGAAI